MAAAIEVVGFVSGLSVLFCFHRANKDIAVSVSESDELVRILNLAKGLFEDVIPCWAGIRGLLASARWATARQCNLMKAQPYWTCRLYGWVHITLIKSHFWLAIDPIRLSLAKQRTRFLVWLFLLSDGVINEAASKISCGRLVRVRLEWKAACLAMCPLT